MRFPLHAILLLVLAANATAAEVRRYAIISLIGDKMQIATAKTVESAMVDRVERNYLVLEDPVLDRTALQAANAELMKADPKAVPVLLQAKDRMFYDEQGSLATPGANAALLAKLRDQLKNTQATHLVAILKDHFDGVPELQRPFVGSRDLEGVGFFIGRSVSPNPSNPSAIGPSFLAPFAYFRVALIDLDSGVAVKQERAQASNAISAEQSMTGNAWEVLSAQQKVQTLQDMIRREIARVMPLVVK